jgi:hypothetical protein
VYLTQCLQFPESNAARAEAGVGSKDRYLRVPPRFTGFVLGPVANFSGPSHDSIFADAFLFPEHYPIRKPDVWFETAMEPFFGRWRYLCHPPP